MPEGVTTATQTVTLNSSGFGGIFSGKYDLVIADVHARTELYFAVHKSLPCELKIYHMVFCMNRVCCARFTVISMLCIFIFEEEFVLQCFIKCLMLNSE